ncbi:type I restriction-modification system subunit M [Brachyspira alvinipulli]|uniref:type I restriction-modification system subunit M n=1 Tax=Brachyspira alvinipulli TaxID=84379 RepID=UPI000486C4A4|nr:type I restriction-modification system subunit M [Brachyspira alvinipulli]
MKTTKETIENIVWKACDTFRGSIDSSVYKDYILSMLFVKYLSDFVKEKSNKNILSKIDYKISDVSSFDYLYSMREEYNIGEIINRALHEIEKQNPDKFEGIFNNIDFNDSSKFGNIKNTILKNLLEDFNDPALDLRPSVLYNNDVMGDVYEYLIKNFAGDAGKRGGEFFTPPEVSILMAKIVSYKRKGILKVYDPTCGSGSLLLKIYKELGGNNCSIYGQEKNSQTYSLCKMNMYLNEMMDKAVIKWGDTIKEPKFIDSNGNLEKFDIVIANPPFSLDKWGEEIAEHDKYKRFEYGIPPKSKGDYAFILHMINSMSENGITAVVMPHGVLFRGASEGIIRKRIIEDNLLDAVIGLPNNLFYSTSIPSCILILKKNRKEKDILFIDAGLEYEKCKNQNRLRDEDIEKIYNTYKNRKDIEKYSKKASIEEIKENEYNLNISRYIDSFEEEERINLKRIIKEIDALEKENAELNNKLENILKDIKFII